MLSPSVRHDSETRMVLDRIRTYTMILFEMASPEENAKSGRFVIRMPPELHMALYEAARERGLSLNSYCVQQLAAAGLGPMAEHDATRLTARALAVATGGLCAVVLYGSWVRGRAMRASDVDALIVVEDRVPVNRELYRAWDAAPPVTWKGRRLDPHFVHLPTEVGASGLWAEVALDGIVLVDRRWNVSAYLGRVRRAIAAGRLARHLVHGQPYWVGRP